jgi:drug/metabolite transporter (DMT)-like permease
MTPLNERFWPSVAKYQTTTFIIAVASIVITILWIWRIGRKRSNWLRWAWCVLSLIGLYSLVEAWRGRALHPIWSALTAGEAIVAVATTVLLFTGDAVPWFRKGLAVDPATFD